MSLFAELAAGRAGVRLRSDPSSIELQQDDPDHARWIDRTQLVTVLVYRHRFRLDLGDGRAPGLRAELEREARGQFEREYARSAKQKPADAKPRTADPSWSPIVEAEVVELRGGRALRCMHRLSYQPGLECIRASISCPVADGIITIAAIHLAEITGMRESVLMMPLLEASQGRPEHPGQAFFDAPEHDERFPRHGLTCLRRLMASWLDPSQGGLEITRPDRPTPAGERIELRAAESSIVPPVGFQRLWPELFPMSPSLALFARVGLDANAPTLFDVWKVPVPPTRAIDAGTLAAIAEQTARGWASEGARNIETETRVIERSRFRAELLATTEFDAAGGRKLSHARWIVDHDGAVFRISISCDPTLESPTVLRDELDAAARSWQRLR